MLADKPIDSIQASDIVALVDSQIPEGRMLDYKQELPGTSPSDRKEFLADVSAFANTSGGDILYGITEARDSDGKCTGVPEAILGVPITNPDAEILKLQNMLRDGLQPRLPDCRIRAINGFSLGPVVLIRTRRSVLGPHRVVFQDEGRFYARTSSGKYRMDWGQLREAFAQSISTLERIRVFRANRVSAILAKDIPILLFHVTPAVSLQSEAQAGALEAAVAMLRTRDIKIIGQGLPVSGRYNIDGYLSYVQEVADCTWFVQLFRDGSIEVVCSDILFRYNPQAGNNVLRDHWMGQVLIARMKEVLKIHRAMGIDYPVYVLLSLLNCKGHILAHSLKPSGGGSVMDRNEILVPELLISEHPESVEEALRPCFDSLWQAAGFARCMRYDESGRWQEPEDAHLIS